MSLERTQRLVHESDAQSFPKPNNVKGELQKMFE